MSVNKLILVGRVGKIDDLKETTSSKVIKFSLATSDSYKDKQGNKVENTEWHDCEAWGRIAEVIQEYVEVGRELYVEGSIRTSTWEKEGVKQYRKFVRVDNIQMIGSKSEKAKSTNQVEDSF